MFNIMDWKLNNIRYSGINQDMEHLFLLLKME